MTKKKASKKNAAMTRSTTPKGDRDRLATPPWLFARIQNVLGLEFVRDVCAEKHSAKCSKFWSKKDDALKIRWADHHPPLSPLFMNCPYSRQDIWTEKAALEAERGLIIVGLIQDTRSSAWYRNNVHGIAPQAYLPDGRISFLLPDGTPKTGNPWPSVFPVWTPWKTGTTEYVFFTRKPEQQA